MATILFIGEDYLKNKTPLAKNIDVEMITPQIEFSQDAYIQNILGSKLYTSLQLAYSAQTLDTYQAELVALIKPTLANRAAQESLPFIHIQLKNKGAMLLNAESGQQAQLDDMKYLLELLRGRAEYYEQRVIEYLIANSDKFPDYTHPDNFGIQPDTASAFTSELYVRDYSNEFGSFCNHCGSYGCDCLCGYSRWN